MFKALFDTLKLLDGGINLVDSILKLTRGAGIVVTELVPEVDKLVLEIGHIYILAARKGEFLLVLDCVLGRINKEHYKRLEELRADDKHLWIAVGNIYNTGIV